MEEEVLTPNTLKLLTSSRRDARGGSTAKASDDAIIDVYKVWRTMAFNSAPKEVASRLVGTKGGGIMPQQLRDALKKFKKRGLHPSQRAQRDDGRGRGRGGSDDDGESPPLNSCTRCRAGAVM